MTGPLRRAIKRVPGHERILLAALFEVSGRAAAAQGATPPDSSLLRPLPYLLYMADGDGGDGYNVFAGTKLRPVQKVFKKNPIVDCSPPAEMVLSMGLAAGARRRSACRPPEQPTPPPERRFALPALAARVPCGPCTLACNSTKLAAVHVHVHVHVHAWDSVAQNSLASVVLPRRPSNTARRRARTMPSLLARDAK